MQAALNTPSTTHAVAPDAPARAKQMRFLMARGFSGDVVHRVVRGRDGPDAG